MQKPSQIKRQITESAAARKKREHDAEIGVKVVATLQLWYNEAIAPLEARVRQLEAERALWRKIISRIRRPARRDAQPEPEGAE